MGAFCPKFASTQAGQGMYKHALMHKIHTFDKYFEYCKADWDAYQEMWKSFGDVHDYVPYPYTKDIYLDFTKTYNEATGANISLDGPDPKQFTEQIPEWYLQQHRAVAPVLVQECMGQALHDKKSDEARMKAAKGRLFTERAKITSSSTTSAMDFDFAQLQQWENWTSGKCVVKDFPCGHVDIGSDKDAWQAIYDA